jgi:putative membrane protein
VVGLLLYWTTLRQVGFGLIFFCGVCMILASLVLLTISRRYWAAALLQGALPLVGLILFVIGEIE